MSARDEIDPQGIYLDHLDANEILALENAVVNCAIDWFNDDTPFKRATTASLTESLERIIAARK